MKKLILLLLVGIFLISSVYAFGESVSIDSRLKDGLTISDTAKIYPAISIKGFWDFMPLIEDTKADLVLTEHSETCGIDCLSQFQIKTYSESSLIDDIKFYRLDEGKTEERNIRSFQFQYWGDVIDYKTECSPAKLTEEELRNETKPYDVCIQVESGKHKDFINYNMGDVLPAGTYDIKIIGQKAPYMSIDWVIKTQGKMINEWATWGNISTGSQAEVILNSPTNGAIQYVRLVTTNASANVTGGAFLVNTTLFDNSTGTWEAKNSSSLSAGYGENYTVNDDDFSQITGTNWRGQTFTIGATGTNISMPIDKIGLKLSRNTAGNLNVSIYAQNGADIPVGSALATGVLDTTPVTTDAGGDWYNVTLTSSYTFQAGTKYAIVISHQAVGDTEWRQDGSAPAYTEGLAINSADSGASWTALAPNERLFIIYPKVGTTATQTYSNTYLSGSVVKWNMQFCDSDGDCGFATSNYTFSIDSTAPTINLSYPTSLIDYGKLNGTLQLNFTAIDTNLDKVWYNYNGTNVTIAGAVSGVANLSNITLSTKKNVTIYANDTAGNLNATTFSWDYKVFENGQTYTTPVYETQITNFAINLTYDSSAPLIAILNYDGINYSSINTGSGNNGYFTSSNFNIPLINTTTNKSFYWILNYNGTIINTNALNQTVNQLIITQCNTTYGTTAINFTFYEELNQTIFNASAYPTTFLFNIKYWIGDGSIKKNYSYQNLSSSLNNFKFCLGQNITYQADVDVQYFATSYAERTYYLRNESITNSTKEVFLYNLLTSEATKFEVKVKQGTEVFTNALVNIYKYFVGLNQYKLIMVGLTDNVGSFTANLDLDQAYNLSVEKDNTDYGSFSKQTTCLVAPCELSLNVENIILNPNDLFYDYFAKNVEYNLTQNDTTQMVTLTFIDKLGTAQYWRLLVTSSFTNNDSIISICDSKAYSASGTLTCNYTGYNGDLKAQVFISRSPEKLVDFLTWVNNLDYKTFGESAILVSIIILLVLFFAGVRNPVNALILIPFGLVILKFLQFLPLDWTWIAGFLVVDFWLISRLNT